MNRKAIEIQNMILPEKGYEKAMKTVVEPYLTARKTETYYERSKGQRSFYIRCLADHPRGVVVISHGYTETIEKHLENIYYFLRGGYHVFMPEHCGHGHSYRLCRNTEDLSLVHIDDYNRYVDDLLFVARIALREFPRLPMILYGHSMGGGIAAAAAARAPELFSRLILSSPMIRPSSAPTPWPVACLIAGMFCLIGKNERYVIGNHPYNGPEQFKNSASNSKARFEYYQDKRIAEPLFQMSAPSYGWLWQTARLNHYLQTRAWRQINCPVLVFQASRETYVSNKEQRLFVWKLNRRKKRMAKLIRVPGTRHEIFNSRAELLARYWYRIFDFSSRKFTVKL